MFRISFVEGREQGIGSREQGIGSREQGTGNREQGIGNREQGIGSSCNLYSVICYLHPERLNFVKYCGDLLRD